MVKMGGLSTNSLTCCRREERAFRGDLQRARLESRTSRLLSMRKKIAAPGNPEVSPRVFSRMKVLQSDVDEAVLENIYAATLRHCNSGQRMPTLLTPGRKKQYALEEQFSRLVLARALIQSYNACDQVAAYRKEILELLRFHYKECGTFCEYSHFDLACTLGVAPEKLPSDLTPDNTKWDDIPEEVTIYRGADEIEVGRLGLSWTLDKEVARKFPFMMRHEAKEPILLTATIRKDEAFAFIFSRGNEKEVLVDPETLVGVKVERLEQNPFEQGATPRLWQTFLGA